MFRVLYFLEQLLLNHIKFCDPQDYFQSARNLKILTRGGGNDEPSKQEQQGGEG